MFELRHVDNHILIPMLLFASFCLFKIVDGIIRFVDLLRTTEVVGVTGVNEPHEWLSEDDNVGGWRWVPMAMFLSIFLIIQGLLLMTWFVEVVFDPLNELDRGELPVHITQALVHYRPYEGLQGAWVDYVVHIGFAIIFLALHGVSYQTLRTEVYKDVPYIQRDVRRIYHLIAAMLYALSITYDSAFLASFLRRRKRIQGYVHRLMVPGDYLNIRRPGGEQEIDTFEMAIPRRVWPFASRRRTYIELDQSRRLPTPHRRRPGGQVTCLDCLELEKYLQACLILSSSKPDLEIRRDICLKDSFSNLSQSAADGCHTCQVWYTALLNECFNAQDIADVDDDNPDSPTPVTVGDFKYVGRYSQFQGAWTFEMRISCHLDATIVLFDRFVLNNKEYRFRRSIDHSLQEASMSPDFFSPEDRNIEQNVTNGRIVDTVASWLHQCSDQHPCCHIQENHDLDGPPRLLDLRDGSIKLIDRSYAEPGACWMALSYCWGTYQEVKLTRDSLPQHKVGIEHSSLPNTIQDAIAIARDLRLWYIWVDVLCIIQDDGGEDWNLHAGLMHHIYGGARLTLCVCSAMSATEGFRSGQVSSSQDRRVAQRYRHVMRHKAGLADLLPVVAAYPLPVVRDRSPSNKRGWIFQEEMLSSRTLYWSHHGVYWSCRAMIVGENKTGSDHSPTTAFADGHGEDGETTTMAGRGILDRHEFILAPRETDWDRMIEAYSTRRFTRMSDRLPALQGLAEVYRKSQGGQYLTNAGMWKNRLPQQLLWKVRGTSLPPDHSMRRKSGIGHAPSWSWASIKPEYGVRFHDDRAAEVAVINVVKREDGTSLHLRGRPRRLLEGMKESNGPQATNVDSLQSPLSGSRWIKDFKHCHLKICRIGQPPITIDLDDNLNDEELLITSALKINATRFLILLPGPETGTFRRVGCSQRHQDLTFFDQAAQMDLVLI